MAFITVEDLVGTVEVLVFPKIYRKNRQAFTEENKGVYPRPGVHR